MKIASIIKKGCSLCAFPTDYCATKLPKVLSKTVLSVFVFPALSADSSDTLNRNFSIAFSIIGMFSSHAVSNLSIFFCAEITPTVIR